MSYIIRLIINCAALLCVIPTGLRWRRERQMLTQLQGLASRLQMTTPSASSIAAAAGAVNNSQQGSRASRRGSRQRRASGFDNPAYIVHQTDMDPFKYGGLGSQNEFNASVFGLDPEQFVNEYTQAEIKGLCSYEFIYF